ncbi:MAG: hypothetical protein ACTSPE_08805 [Candidatus Thorarchaeota archaeon]
MGPRRREDWTCKLLWSFEGGGPSWYHIVKFDKYIKKDPWRNLAASCDVY